MSLIQLSPAPQRARQLQFEDVLIKAGGELTLETARRLRERFPSVTLSGRIKFALAHLTALSRGAFPSVGDDDFHHDVARHLLRSWYRLRMNATYSGRSVERHAATIKAMRSNPLLRSVAQSATDAALVPFALDVGGALERDSFIVSLVDMVKSFTGWSTRRTVGAVAELYMKANDFAGIELAPVKPSALLKICQRRDFEGCKAEYLKISVDKIGRN